MTIKSPTPEMIPALRGLWKETFGDSDAFLDGFFRTGFSFDRCRCLLDEAVPVAVLYWFDCTWQDRKLAYIYAVATAETHRGRGLCRKLMGNTHAHLQTLGYAGAILVPGDRNLFRLYGKLGYVPCCPRQITHVPAADAAASVTPIRASDYAAARKNMLPAGSVWQDGSALDFLETFAPFYRCGDCIFSGAVEDNTFYFQEYIGDVEQVPAIIRHFNCKSGVLPVAAGEPGAMFCALQATDCLPEYFGIPLN